MCLDYIKKLFIKTKGKKRIELYSIIGIVFGILLVGIGILGTIFQNQGIFTIIALIGSFITFISIIILVFYWFIVEEVV